MKLSEDNDAFDSLQLRLLEEITREILNSLVKLQIPSDQLQSTTENLAFGIGAIIDGSRVMDLDGEPVQPVLTFADAARES